MTEASDESAASEPRTYGGRPGIATAICALLLVASCAGSLVGETTRTIPNDPAMTLGALVGSALVGALLWGIAYAITSAAPRHAGRWRRSVS